MTKRLNLCDKTLHFFFIFKNYLFSKSFSDPLIARISQLFEFEKFKSRLLCFEYQEN